MITLANPWSPMPSWTACSTVRTVSLCGASRCVSVGPNRASPEGGSGRSGQDRQRPGQLRQRGVQHDSVAAYTWRYRFCTEGLPRRKSKNGLIKNNAKKTNSISCFRDLRAGGQVDQPWWSAPTSFGGQLRSAPVVKFDSVHNRTFERPERRNNEGRHLAERVSSNRFHEAAAGNPYSYRERQPYGNNLYAYFRPAECMTETLTTTYRYI